MKYIYRGPLQNQDFIRCGYIILFPPMYSARYPKKAHLVKTYIT